MVGRLKQPVRYPLRTLLATLCLGLGAVGLWQVGQAVVIPAKAAIAQVLLERAFDATVADGVARKPWPWADMRPVARLRLPRLGEQRIVLDTGSGQAMAFGPALLPDGARLGEPGSVVIAAHRDTHFRVLQRVRVGDVLTVEDREGAIRRYRVTGTEIVRWDRFAVADHGGWPRLALATCYPFGATRQGPRRYVVRAVQVDRPSA